MTSENNVIIDKATPDNSNYGHESEINIDAPATSLDIVKKYSLAQMNSMLAANPKPAWVLKDYNGYPYIPIGKVECILNEIFGVWRFELLYEPKVILNAVMITGMLHVYCHPLNMWWSRPGAAAWSLQFSKKTKALDRDALKKAHPAAVSAAISNGAKRLGRVFGAGLRNDKRYG